MDLKSITWVFFKQLIFLGIETLLNFGVITIVVVLMIDTFGICTRADHDDYVTRTNQKEIETCDINEISSYLPKFCTYSVYDKDGNLLATTMTEKQFKDKELYETGKRTDKRNLFKYYERPEGYVAIRYSYVAHYKDDFLYYHLPDFENTFSALVVINFILLLCWRASRIKRLLTRELKPLLTEIEQINNNILDENIDEEIQLSAITEIAEVQQVLKHIKKDLSESLKTQWESEQRRKENMAALAHDIKTPLTVINGNMDLMMEDVEDIKKEASDNQRELTADMEELSQGIYRNSRRIQGYVSLLMDESRVVKKEVCSVSDFAADIINQSVELATANYITLGINVAEVDANSKIKVDVQRTQRAIINIVRNAIDYTDREKGIAISVDVVEKKLIFEVEDYGNGFSEEALKHYSEQFYTEDKARSGEHFGLGLFFASQVAKECNGEITVINNENGAKVSFCIPLNNL